MLESAIKIEDLIGLAKKHNMKAVCLSDRGNLFASLEFALGAAQKGLQPIHGIILNLLSEEGSEFSEILLIAKDETGYKNLLKLGSYGFIKNDRTVCNHITYQDLIQHHQGLIVLSAYTKGVIGKSLLARDYDKAVREAKKFQSILGNDCRFYLEIMRHGLESEKQIESEYLRLARELKLPLIATNQVLFSDITMHDAHDILLCISASVVKDAENRPRVSNQCYFKSSQEMIELFADLPEAVENTVNLAKRISVMARSRKPSLPHFTEPSLQVMDCHAPLHSARNGGGELSSPRGDEGDAAIHLLEEELIRKESTKTLAQKLSIKFAIEKTPEDEKQKIYDEYMERLEYELGVICKMNFQGYFLIVSDFIRWSKKQGIAVGPGRGSGAGSIVAWCLQITDLDPIKFGLLFERFLNPERVSMPDFDIDFCQERREEAIEYVRAKYGNHRVGQIITFGKMQAKAVIKDVARVLGLAYSVADYLTELVPFNAVSPVSLRQAIEEISELRDAAEGKGLDNIDGDSELIKQVLDAALILEGLHRHSSTHAAGIVIANDDMIETVPLCKDNGSDMMIVQYSMKYCELSGLIKFDFLGLQTLTVINKCLGLLRHQGIDVNLDTVGFEDKKTFEMLSKGISSGVFQFESVGMKSALRKLRPDNIGDIIALGALYRPGPMDNIPAFIACKHGQQEVDYMHPSLEPTLKNTYGIIVYQEQVLEIARKLSGYSLGAADLLRRAMGKKVKAEMDAQEEIFVSGAVKNNIPASQAKAIFEKVAKFAGYGFNKAHASAYGVISYQTAFLKANFPAEFLVAAMNLDIHDSDKINVFLQEAKLFDLKIVPPSINGSDGYFKIQNTAGKKSIIFALGAIKNVTVNFGKELERVRAEKGQFKTILDFIERIPPKLLNRKSLENIIKAGCFDQVHSNRNALLQSVPKLIAYSAAYHTEAESSQFSLLAVKQNIDDVLLPMIPEFDKQELAYSEFEVIGLFIDNHPLESYKQLLQERGVKNAFYVKNELSVGSYSCKIAGVIIKKDTRMSKRGRFLTIMLSDPSGIIEVTIFNEDIMRDYASMLGIRTIVVVNCDVFIDQGGARITARNFTSIDDVINHEYQELRLFPKNRDDLIRVMDILKNKTGLEKANSSVSIFYNNEGGFKSKITLPDKFYLDSSDIVKLTSYKI